MPHAVVLVNTSEHCSPNLRILGFSLPTLIGRYFNCLLPSSCRKNHGRTAGPLVVPCRNGRDDSVVNCVVGARGVTTLMCTTDNCGCCELIECELLHESFSPAEYRRALARSRIFYTTWALGKARQPASRSQSRTTPVVSRRSRISRSTRGVTVHDDHSCHTG